MELYTGRITALTEEIRQLNKYNRLVVVLELLAIALAIGCVVAYTMWGQRGRAGSGGGVYCCLRGDTLARQ